MTKDSHMFEWLKLLVKVEIGSINFVITVKVTLSKLRTDKCLSNRALTSIGGKYSIKYSWNFKTLKLGIKWGNIIFLMYLKRDYQRVWKISIFIFWLSVFTVDLTYVKMFLERYVTNKKATNYFSKWDFNPIISKDAISCSVGLLNECNFLFGGFISTAKRCS